MITLLVTKQISSPAGHEHDSEFSSADINPLEPFGMYENRRLAASMCVWQICRNNVMQSYQHGAEVQRKVSSILCNQCRVESLPCLSMLILIKHAGSVPFQIYLLKWIRVLKLLKIFKQQIGPWVLKKCVDERYLWMLSQLLRHCIYPGFNMAAGCCININSVSNHLVSSSSVSHVCIFAT